MQNEAFEHYFLTRHGCPIHYWLAGDKQNALVAFIHGAGADHHIFDPQIAELTPYFRLLLWDMSGQGLSHPTQTTFSIREAAEDLVALLDHLGYAHTALVGLSLGGTIAQEIVLSFPERVSALVIIGAPSNILPLTPLTCLMLKLFIFLTRYAPISFIRFFHAFFASMETEARHYVYHSFLRVSQQTHRHIWEAFNEVFSTVHTYRNGQISCPLLLVHGDHDNSWNKWLMKRWTESAFDCQYAVISHAGHLANWDGKKEFNRLLIDFLKLGMEPVVKERDQYEEKSK